MAAILLSFLLHTLNVSMAWWRERGWGVGGDEVSEGGRGDDGVREEGHEEGGKEVEEEK